MNFIQFKEALLRQGIFSVDHIRLFFPDFNNDNLLYWQKKGYIYKIRNKWYCFREFTDITGYQYLIANIIYSPSYISHQEALSFYGLIPESIVDAVSVTTRKTANFHFLKRTYKYFSISRKYFFGYELKEMDVNGINRHFLMADREKAILDLLYLYDFYKNEQDIAEIRFNEYLLENEIDWNKMGNYLGRFRNNMLEKKIRILQKIYNI